MPESAAPSSRRFGAYELLERLGEGGMAEVWRARSRGVAGFEKIVVIKRVLPALAVNAGFVDLLVREAKIAARLSHANIVQIFDLGEEGGSYFIAMEHVHGRDLGAVCARVARDPTLMALPLRLHVVAEVAQGLDYAHRRRGDDGRPLSIIHRDVSPQNVLLSYEGEVKLTDFGIARAEAEGLGAEEDAGVLRGKYAYMSPEQARGEELDRRSDVFSLGVVLFELLTGTRLFRGRSSAETLALVRDAFIPRPSSVAPWLSRDVDPVVLRALAADREQRFSSAGEVASALHELLRASQAPAGGPELAAFLRRAFPETADTLPNKINVDVLLRAYEDATAVSSDDKQGRGAAGRERTAAGLPRTSRRFEADPRELVVLAVGSSLPEHLAYLDQLARARGGVVPPVPGNLALFGAGAVGNERAAEHAARTAIELRRRIALDMVEGLDVPPPLAIGVAALAIGAAPPAVVPQPVVSALEAELSAISAGEIAVVPALGKQLEPLLRLRALDTSLLVEGYRARREREAMAMRRASPLCGRREPLRALAQLVSAASEGRGLAATVVGEAGSGKSRLVAELRTLASALDVQWLAAGGDESRPEDAYHTLAELFLDVCGIEEFDAPETRFAAVERLRVLGLTPSEVRSVGRLVGLSYPVAESDRRRVRPRALVLLGVLRKVVRALAADRPVVLALEDLQWIDPATRELLPLLAESLERARVLLLVSGRPDAPFPSLSLPGERVVLAGLEPADAERLLASMLGARSLSAELARAACDRAGGNPRLLEEIGAMLLARRVTSVHGGEATLVPGAEIEVPQTLRALAAAQLATLPAEERRVLRIACVLDRPANLGFVAAVEGLDPERVGVAFARLVRARLLVPVDAAPDEPPGAAASSSGATLGPTVAPTVGAWGGSPERPAAQDVAPANQLLRDAVEAATSSAELARTHERIVAFLEAVSDEALPDRVERLAFHALRAPDRGRAVRHLTAAATLARERGDLAAAAVHALDAAHVLRQARPDADEEVLALALDAARDAQAQRLDALGDEALALAVELCEAGGDARRAELDLRLAHAAHRDGRSDDAIDRLAAVLTDPAAGSDTRIEALRLAAAVRRERGELQAAVATLEQALSELALDEAEVRADVLSQLGTCLARLARPAEASRAAAEAQRIAAALDCPRVEAEALAASAEAAEAAQDHGSAGELFVAASELARRVGDAERAAGLVLRAAFAWTFAGDQDRAAALAADAASTAGALGLRSEEAAALALAAYHEHFARDAGEAADALVALLADTPVDRRTLALLHGLAAAAEHEAGRADAGDAALARATALANEAGDAALGTRLASLGVRGA